MRFTLTTLAFAALSFANPFPQGVTSAIAPQASSPPGCMDTYPGSFQIAIVNVPSKKRDVNGENTPLLITLKDGILKDTDGRTGYVASNHQFQFDGPPQDGAIYTAGFSICSNASLALGNTAIWYKCLSGNFYNLYNSNWAPQCSEIYIVAVNDDAAPTTTAALTAEDRVAGGAASSVAVEKTDGQLTATPLTSLPVSEYSDGQPQVPTSAVPVTSAPVATSAPACSEYADGQPQCSTTAQMTPAPVATSSAASVSAAACDEHSDGQPQCATTTPTAAATTWAPTSNYTGVSVPPAMGTAYSLGVQHVVFGLAAGILAFALL